MNKLYISLLLIFMPAFIACKDRLTTIAELQLDLASTQAVDAFIQEKILLMQNSRLEWGHNYGSNELDLLKM